MARSGFYAWRQRQDAPGKRAAENAVITAEITAVLEEHRGFYESPRIHRELRASGRHVGRDRVARLIRWAQLRARTRKAFRPCSKAGAGAGGVVENLLLQDFQPPPANRCWAGDITYIRTTSGWRDPAVWIDLFSRRVVGWKLETCMDAALGIQALNRALVHRRVELAQVLIHIEESRQNRANDYRELLQKEKITCSMSAKGCCWDNEVVKTFFSTLKLQLNLDDDREVLISPQQLQRDLPSGSMVTTTASGAIQRSAS